MRALVSVLLCVLVPLCSGQNAVIPDKKNLHLGLSERIGNFSVELLYYTTAAQERGTNLIISPITVWTVLAVIAEGATVNTLTEICKAIRIVPKNRQLVRDNFQNIQQFLEVKTKTVELQKLNSMFVDQTNRPESDFIEIAKQYETSLIPLNFSDPDHTSNTINDVISNFTHGRILKLIDSNDLRDSHMVLSSALYFKGQWTLPFNSSFTMKRPFYNSAGEVIGQVNMMYNRYTYPFANIEALQGRVIEIQYGTENRLSMLIMVPYPGVSLPEMFYNFNNISLDLVFAELKIAKEEYADDEVDAFIPRFKIETNIDLTESLKEMGIHDMFDETKARLPKITRVPTFVKKVVHKAEIEVTEEGTTASAVTAAEFSNRIGVLRFEANRPFCYLIVEKTTNTIAFGGFYQVPELF
ncbi:serine protease inhibitor 77Ba-like [Colias croceus]|uniref:serine protease inhibitor 77Ba-like n=1 Tax=Colias crocea TaxID=72248 RepID=UPI001E27CF93|nr:serine protease inhibitor 77Ba-like [Colias croceus]